MVAPTLFLKFFGESKGNFFQKATCGGALARETTSHANNIPRKYSSRIFFLKVFEGSKGNFFQKATCGGALARETTFHANNIPRKYSSHIFFLKVFGESRGAFFKKPLWRTPRTPTSPLTAHSLRAWCRGGQGFPLPSTP